ncbi:MAG: hypothetical protein DMG74_00795 [Acidobacteria bacterium]|nr:MAG: hypothetical protein DMG74_00795 [Acidobacteriota bacterium]
MTPLSSAAISDAPLVAAYAIFLTSYVVFAIGKFPGCKIDRTGAAIIGAVGMVAFRIVRPAAVIFTCGFLSAFFVNDIVCLVMVPFVLSITRRMKLVPLLYLLAVATASNIGSVSTMTGNPQNMLIGSFSGIKYRDLVKQFRHYAVDSSLNKNQGVPEGEPMKCDESGTGQ